MGLDEAGKEKWNTKRFVCDTQENFLSCALGLAYKEFYPKSLHLSDLVIQNRHTILQWPKHECPDTPTET